MHRITGKKEPVQYLHRLGLSVSYNRVLAINNAWAMSQPKTHYQFANVRSLHSTTDNSDLKQETRDGGNTSHYTNRTLFHIVLPDENPSDFLRSREELALLPKQKEIPLPLIYSHGARVEPKRFSNFKDIEYKANLKKCLKKDFLWSLVHGLPENCEKTNTGSWTVFNRDTSCSAKEKSII